MTNSGVKGAGAFARIEVSGSLAYHLGRILEPSDDFCMVDADCDRSLLVFSHRGAKSFALYEFFRSFPFNRMFVRDPTSGWYNGNLRGLGDAPDRVASTLARHLSAFGPGWTGALGSSMGGYGAILYGCLLGVDRVLAFSPQTVLDPMYPLAPPAALPCLVPDLRPLVSQAPRTGVRVVCGEDDLVDLYYAGRLAALPNVEVLTAPGADHLILGGLHQRGELKGVVLDWADGRPSPKLQHAEVLDDPTVAEGISEAIPAFHRGEYAAAAHALGAIVAERPRWVGAACMFGRTLLKSSEPQRAEAVLRSAMELSPSLPEPPRYLARALMAQRRYPEALPYLARCVELLPEWAEAYYDIGDCRVLIGDFGGAEAAFRRATELKPTWPMPKSRLTELGSSSTRENG